MLKKITAFGIVFLLLFGCVGCSGAEAPEEQVVNSNQPSVEFTEVDVPDEQSSATIEVNFVGDEKFVRTIYDVEGMTAFDLLDQSGVVYTYEESSYGPFITSIREIENGSEGEMSCWMYNINGEPAQVGCGSYELQDGDVITWTFERNAV